MIPFMDLELKAHQVLLEQDHTQELVLNAKVSLKENPKAWLKLKLRIKIMQEVLMLGLMTVLLIEI